MKTKLPWTIGGVALLVIGGALALLMWLRTGDARAFGQACSVRTYSGTNYVFQPLAITVGKADTGCVLIVSARLENPNPSTLVLRREWFVLIDHDKDYFSPVTTGTQTETIQIPANSVIEKESFTFVVPDDSLNGLLALMAGHHYLVTLKSDKPFSRQLQKDQFFTFRQRDW